MIFTYIKGCLKREPGCLIGTATKTGQDAGRPVPSEHWDTPIPRDLKNLVWKHVIFGSLYAISCLNTHVR